MRVDPATEVQKEINTVIGGLMGIRKSLAAVQEEIRTWKPDWSALPEDWTLEDIERQMPLGLRRIKRVCRLTFTFTPRPEINQPEIPREFFFNLNIDEKHTTRREFEKLVAEGLVKEFRVDEVPIGRPDFLNTVINLIQSKKEVFMSGYCEHCGAFKPDDLRMCAKCGKLPPMKVYIPPPMPKRS